MAAIDGPAAARGDLGTPPDLRWLPIDRLDIDPAYQRSTEIPASRRLIARIAANWDWRRCGALMAFPGVSSDRWDVFDGQHRIEAAIARGGIPELPALVFERMSSVEAASAFVGANRDRVPMSAQALFWARVAAGDAEALTVKRLCEAAGVRILRSNLASRQMPAGSTAALPALLRLVKIHGESVAGAAIAICAEILGREPGGLRGPYFLAAGRFLAEENGSAGLRLGLRALGPAGLAAICGHSSGWTVAVPAIVAALRDKAGIAMPAPKAARDVPAGESWAFREHRTQVEIGPAPTAPKPKVGTALPIKTAPVPSVPTAAANESPDQAAIRAYLETKGARIVLSPEQAATYLRRRGIDASVRVAKERQHSRAPLWIDPEYRVRGQIVTEARFFEIVNRERAASGLPPVALPPAPEKKPYGYSKPETDAVGAPA